MQRRICTKGFCPKVARRVAGAHTPACAWKSSPKALLGKFSSVWQRVQVFVANPNKTPAIVTILVSNRDKLLKYLGDFHTDKGSRTWFRSSRCVKTVARFEQGVLVRKQGVMHLRGTDSMSASKAVSVVGRTESSVLLDHAEL